MTIDRENYGSTILGITGHRPDKLGGYNNFTNLSAPLKFQMSMFFQNKAPARIISGMAVGVDQGAVEMALNLDIKVTAMLPCVNQGKLWPYTIQCHYHDLLEQIERRGGQVNFVSLEEYTVGCMHRRNREIIENSTELLAVWDGTKGGTKDCIKLGRSAGISITILDPKTMTFRVLENEHDRLREAE